MGTASNGPQDRNAIDRQFQSALSRYNSSQYQDAARELEDMVVRLPASFDVQELLGLVYSAEGKDQEAHMRFEKAVQLRPNSGAARANLAVNLSKLGKNSEAEGQFKKAIALEPHNYEANHDFGEFYVRAGNLVAAIPYLEEAQRVDPSSYENGYDLALADTETGKYDEARAVINALTRQQDTAELHDLLAEVEEKSGNYLAAEREYERAAHMEPSEKNIFNWGTELLLHQTPEPAIEVFTTGVKRYPRSARLQIGLGIALYSRGSYDEAVNAFSLATDLEPSDPHPYLFLAKAYNISTKQADQVTERLRRFVELEPRNAQARYYYALSLWKGKREQERPADLDQIRALLEGAASLDPRFADPHLELGSLWASQHKYPEAIREYEQSIKLEPDRPDGHYRLGQALVRSGDKERAQQEFALYDRLHKEQVAENEKRRSEIKQFVLTMQENPKARSQ